MNLDKSFLSEYILKIAKEKLGSEIRNLKFIGGGSFGKVFKGEKENGEVLIFKAYFVSGMEEAEASQLKLLSENTVVPMPEVFFTYNDEKIALLCMSFIKGKNALDPSFLLKSKKQKEAFAEAVIDGMLEWHSVTGEKYGYTDNARYGTWRDFYIEEKAKKDLAALKELSEKGKLSKKSYKLLEEAFEIFKDIYEEPQSPVLIHGDLNIMNIMAEEKDMSLTGFIDPCGSMWADREYDLFQLKNMWGDFFGLYKTYKKKYPVSKHCDFKVAFYGTLHEYSMRLKGGLVIPVWEIENSLRLKKEMKKYR